MDEDLTVGTLGIDVEANIDPAVKTMAGEATQKLKAEGEKAGKAAGKAFTDGFAKEAQAAGKAADDGLGPIRELQDRIKQGRGRLNQLEQDIKSLGQSSEGSRNRLLLLGAAVAALTIGATVLMRFLRAAEDAALAFDRATGRLRELQDASAGADDAQKGFLRTAGQAVLELKGGTEGATRATEAYDQLGGAVSRLTPLWQFLGRQVAAIIEGFRRFNDLLVGGTLSGFGFLAEGLAFLASGYAKALEVAGKFYNFIGADERAGRLAADAEAARKVVEDLEAIAARSRDLGRTRFEAGLAASPAGTVPGVGATGERELAEAKRRAEEAKRERERAAREAEAEAERQARAAEQLAARRLQLEEQLADQLAKLTKSTADEAILQLERMEAAWRDAFGAIDAEAAAAFQKMRDAISAGARVEELREQLEAFADIRVRTFEDAGAATTAIAAVIRTIEEERDALEEGSVVRDRYNKLLEDGAKLLDRVAKAATDAAENEGRAAKRTADERRRQLEEAKQAEEDRLLRLRDQARTIEENARAAIQLAEAFGFIGGEAADALQDVAQLGAAIARVAAGDLSAIPSLIGGVASLASRAFGGGEEDERRREAAEELIRDLDDLHVQFRDLAEAVGPLQSAIRRASDLLETLGERLGLPGVDSPQAAAAERDRLVTARAELVRRRPEAPTAVQPNIDAAIADLDQKIAELNQGLVEYDAALEEVGRQFREDVELRALAVEGTDADLAARRQQIQHEAQVRDARAALDAGAITEADVARLLYVQGLEREALALAEAERKRRANEDAQQSILDLRAGLTGSKDDAVAAARGRAVLNRDRELEQYRELVEAGDITQETFDILARLLDEKVVKSVNDVAAAFDDAAEAAARAAVETQQGIDELFFTLTGDDKGLAGEQIQGRADDFRRQVQDAFDQGAISFDKVTELFGLIDEWVKDQLGALEVTDPNIEAALAGDARRDREVGTETGRLAGASTETSVVQLSDIARAQYHFQRQHLPFLRTIDETLKAMAEGGGIRLPAPIPGGIGGPTVTSNSSSTVEIRAPITVEVHGVSELEAERVGRGIRHGLLSPNHQLHDDFVQDRKRTGNARKL